jgi:glycosyltransferase involved in cell wall biosynthesis/O-antigen ligase
MLPAVVLIAAGFITVRALGDDRRAAFVLGLVIATNASGVLGTVHDMPGFLVPMAAVLLVAGLVRGRRDAGGLSGDALIGPALLAAIFVSGAIGPFVADAPTASSQAVARLAQDVVLIAAVVANARRPDAIKASLAGFATGGLLMAAITVVQWATGDRSSFGGFGAWTVHELADVGMVSRAAGPFIDDPNSYAQYLSIAIFAATGLAMVASRRRERLAWALGAGWITAALLLTRSRSGLISLIIVAAGALLVTRRPKHLAVAVLAGAGLLVFTPLAAFSRIGTLTSAAAAGPAAADTSVLGRTSEARAALEMFVDHPVTGVGFGAYPSEYVDHARRIGLDTRFEARSAHSLPLEIAAEQGLLGLAAWGALIVFTVATVRMFRRTRPDAATPLALALGALAASSLFLHDVYPQAMWLLIGLIVGASIWLHRSPTPVDPPPTRHTAVPGRERLLVAMVIQNYVPALGGAEHQLANLAPLMAKRGIEPVVITRRCPGRPHHDEIAGIRVLRVPTYGPKPMRAAIFIAGALRHLARLRPDVVHAFDTFSPSTIALAHRRRYGTPVAVKLLRSGPLGDLDRLACAPGGSARRRRLLDEADMFVAISTDIDSELARLGVEPRRRIFVANGVDTKRFSPPPRRPQHRKGGAVVIATGRLAPEKRLVELAERWSRVSAVHGARLVLIGDGVQRPLLEGRDGVELRGQVDDVAAALRRADVYVSASAAEGLSNSLLEAMSAGLPCVVTDVGGVRDVIKSDEHGVVVPADDLDRLVEEVIALLIDRGRRRVVGAAARSRVSEGWALATTADRLVALYRRLASPDVSTARAERSKLVVAE